MLFARATTRPPRRSSRRGVTLIELLVVLAILLLIFAMGGVLIGPPLKKARLASAANDILVLAKKVPVESRTQRAGQGLFVFLKATPGTSTFELVADSNPAPSGDGVFQDPSGGGTTDALIASIPSIQLPDGIVFYDMPAPYGNCWTNWGASGTAFVLGVDFQGRAILPNGRQIAGTAAINLTHADMASGAVTPLIVHRITFGAVWSVRDTLLVKDPAATGGWREF
ncbi:MAG: prepilin-type N-terminal cleavage/methylation domain-containing protein [Thermoanaerobaculia bacterium]